MRLPWALPRKRQKISLNMHISSNTERFGFLVGQIVIYRKFFRTLFGKISRAPTRLRRPTSKYKWRCSEHQNEVYTFIAL